MILTTQPKKYMIVDGSQIETSMGEVCQAIDTTLGRKVAVKRVHIEGESKKFLEINRRKAETELKLILSLETAEIHVPRIYDYWYNEKARDLATLWKQECKTWSPLSFYQR